MGNPVITLSQFMHQLNVHAVGAHFISLVGNCYITLKVLVATIDAQWQGMGDVGSARYELALLPPRPTIRVLSYNN